MNSQIQIVKILLWNVCFHFVCAAIALTASGRLDPECPATGYIWLSSRCLCQRWPFLPLERRNHRRNYYSLPAVVRLTLPEGGGRLPGFVVVLNSDVPVPAAAGCSHRFLDHIPIVFSMMKEVLHCLVCVSVCYVWPGDRLGDRPVLAARPIYP